MPLTRPPNPKAPWCYTKVHKNKKKWKLIFDNSFQQICLHDRCLQAFDLRDCPDTKLKEHLKIFKHSDCAENCRQCAVNAKRAVPSPSVSSDITSDSSSTPSESLGATGPSLKIPSQKRSSPMMRKTPSKNPRNNSYCRSPSPVTPSSSSSWSPFASSKSTPPSASSSHTPFPPSVSRSSITPSGGLFTKDAGQPSKFSFIDDEENRQTWSSLPTSVVERIAFNSLNMIFRMKRNNNIRRYLLGRALHGLSRKSVPEKLVSQNRFKDRVDFKVLEKKGSGPFYRLFHGAGMSFSRMSLKKKLQKFAVAFWKDGGRTRASATEVVGKKGNKLPVYYYFDPHDVLLLEYQKFWASSGYKVISDMPEFKKIAEIFEQSTLEHRLVLLKGHRLVLRSVTALMKSKPRWVKYMGSRDFACTHCRRATEFRLYKDKRVQAFHSSCQNAECNLGEECPTVQNGITEELKLSAKDFEACYGYSRYADCKSSADGISTHIENVNKQRQEGFTNDRNRLQTDSKFSVIVADFSGLDKMFRTHQKTQGELRQKQLNILTIAVLTKNVDGVTPLEKHQYFDFIDDRDRNDVAVLKFALLHVIIFLLERNITKFSLWTDNCSKQFHSRKPLYAVLVEIVNYINDKNAAFLEYLKSFVTGSVTASIEEFSWNFFWPQHGKCLCNSHFAVLKSALRQLAHHSDTGGINTLDALREISCEDVHVVETVSFENNLEWMEKITNVFPIPNVKNYHCFVRSFAQGVSTITCYPYSNEKVDKTKGITHSFIINNKDGKKDDEKEKEQEEEIVMGPTKFVEKLLSSFFSAADSFLGKPVTPSSGKGRKAVSNKVSIKKSYGAGNKKNGK